MPTPANELVLSHSQDRIIKSLYKGKSIPAHKIRQTEYCFLAYYSLVKYDNNSYIISEKGKQYVLTHHKDKFRFWFPTMISIIALIISVISLLR